MIDVKNKILATNIVYYCIFHEKYLNKYLKELEKIFYKISKMDNNNLLNKLDYSVSIPGFSRLN